MVKCSCNVHGECIKYGKYKRTFKVNGRKFIIYIQRIYCKNCGKTHAVIPSFLVPYQTKTLRELIEDFEIYLACDEENISFTTEEKRNNANFKNWKERLLSMSIKLTNIIDDIKEIIFFCAKFFSMCIFQKTRKKYTNKTDLYDVYYIAYSHTNILC